MQINVLAMLQTAIAAGVVILVGVSIAYFLLKRSERKKDELRNKKLDIF